MIFAEHAKLTKENPLLKEKIEYYKKYIDICEQKDSLQKEEITLYKKEIKKCKSSKKKYIIGSSIGGIVLFILGLVI